MIAETINYSTHIIDLTVSCLLADNDTLPADELYFEHKPKSGNLGEIDQSALLGAAAKNQVSNPGGAYQILRADDSVTSRNTQAAICGALQLCAAA